MKQRSRIFVSVLATAVVVLAGWAGMAKVRAPFQAESKLWFEGTSSLHDWKCDAPGLSGYVDYETSGKVNSVSLTVPVATIDCGHAAMNKRLQLEMKAKQFATVQYALTTAKTTGKLTPGKPFTVQASGNLTVAGVTKPVALTVTGTPQANGQIKWTGKTPLKMSTFNVTAPAFLGMKTGDDITVSFEVVTTAKK